MIYVTIHLPNFFDIFSAKLSCYRAYIKDKYGLVG